MKWFDRPWIEVRGSSPNVSSRLGTKIDAIVLHYTAGGDIEATWSWFMDSAAQASAHFIVDRDGKIVQVVPLDQRAWHVGQGQFEVNGKRVVEAVDRSAIGIELANYGLLQKQGNDYFYECGHEMRKYNKEKYGPPVMAQLKFMGSVDYVVEGYWEPYREAQIDAAVKLCAELIDEYAIPPQRIVGHEDLAYPVGRKVDPGPCFPWEEFMEQLVGRESKMCRPLPPDVWCYHKTVRW